MADNIIGELLELAAIEEAKWPARLAAIPGWHPRNESGSSGSGGGSGKDDKDDKSSSGKKDDNNNDDDDDDDNDDDDDDTASGGKIDWKKMARRHEREAKRERKAREAAEAKVKERETADQTDHEKAVREAREEGERVAAERATKERRGDRLENATIKLAGKGIKVKIDDEEQTLRFTDPDDAFVNIERMIRNGDLDEDDLFDDKGKVNSEALTEALEELLDAKPHLIAGASNGGNGGTSSGRKVKGSADGGKGSGGGKAVQELSAEEHFERIRQHK